MELFNVINYQQTFGEIQIQKDILETNPQWKKHFQEIELRDFQDVKVNIYYHKYIDFVSIFKNFEFNYYLLEKKENPFITPEKYIERRYFADIKILEIILFSKKSQEEHNGELMREVEISHFPKHFVSLASDLIYTYEKREESAIDYVFIVGKVNFYEYSQKDYFYNLYKFLKEEIYTVFNELEKNHIISQEQKLNQGHKIPDFINEVEVFKADKDLDFAINIENNLKHNYNYFLDYINSNKNKFDNSNLTKYVTVSYFTEDEIIIYLQNSFRNFKEKYVYANTSDYFAKNKDFKFLANQIEEINYSVLGNNPYEDYFTTEIKFLYFGKYKNHLLYYYNKTLYFFDIQYFDSDNINMHFKHIHKIFDGGSENLLRSNTIGNKRGGLEKRITSEIESQLLKSHIIEKITLSQKIKLKGSLQSIGFLFSELIEKGFIEAPKRNGKANTSAISRMILEHFEFIDKEEQPKPEDIRKTLFFENKLSTEKQKLFKIPECKIINTD